MPISPELLELRGRLEEVGMVVVEEPNHLTVRLPYFCSVRVFYDNGRLRFAPFLGMLPRTRATLTKLGLFGAVGLASIRVGTPYTVGIVIIAMMFGIYDVFRVTITEHVITRASMIYSQMRRGSSDSATRARELSGGDNTPRPVLTSGDQMRDRELPRVGDPTIIKRT